MNRTRDKQVAAKYRDGASLVELARLFALTVGAVRAILVALGVEIRPRGRPRRADRAERKAARKAKR